MMNPKTRNRLIGGAALLCLLIIVAPLLNREPEDIGAQAPSPPPPPSLQPSGEAEAVSSERQQQSIDARFAEWDDFEKNQSEKKETAAKPGQCRLRIGIFAKPESIMQRLRDDGRQVSLSHWGENPAGDRLFAVHVGGAMACAEAESLRDELQQRYDMQPLIEYNTQTP